MEIKKFLSAFYQENEDVCIRVFSDRKADDPEFKGQKYTEKLSNIQNLFPALKQHNEKHRGVFFVVNSGGHRDNEITRVNAQFVEMDTGSFGEQQAKIDSFKLKPSIIVRTKKSLHCYWLINNGDIKQFRDIQLRLVKQFDGDSMCQNESRCMRLPGFYHSKQEPVMVECIKFKPEIKYTQAELSKMLPKVQMPEHDGASRTEFKGVVGSGQRLMDKCAYCQHCKKNANQLSEPEWYAFITNMSLAKDGASFVHEISKPYPKYSKAETDDKIRHAVEENKPHTCEYIKNRLGFKGCNSCNVKAPISHALLSMSEQAAELADGEVFEDMIFDNRTIELMAYAKKNAPAAYGKFKQKIKGKCAIKDFEAAIDFRNRSNTMEQDADVPLNLKSIELNGAVQPANWRVTMEHGIQKRINVGTENSLVTVCPSPVVITKRFKNIDFGSEKVELSFYRDNMWTRIVATRSSAFNKSSIINCADRGLPVASKNSSDIVDYLYDYENVNVKNIPLMNSTERLGWLNSTTFFPYTAKKDICFETDFEDSNEIHRSLAEHGNFGIWLENAAKLKDNPYGRFMLASSFASVLLEPLSHRVFFVNIWHDTTSGKSAACKMAVSVWGDPLKLMGSFNATAVGLERKADTLRNILYGLDERQLANESRLPMAQIVYGLSNGFGRIRGNKEGGVQSMTNWRLIVLSTAEEPLLSDDSHDGMSTRVMEIHGVPVNDKSFAAQLHNTSEKNYGFAGRRFVERLCNEIRHKKDMLQNDFARIRQGIKNKIPSATHLENAAVIALGDYYSDMWIWDADKAIAFENAVNTAAMMIENNVALEKEDIISRAWQYITDWCVANDKAFGDDAPIRYGFKENAGSYYVLKFAIDDALRRKNYPIEECMTGFFERGYMALNGNRRQIQRRREGKVSRYYVINIEADNSQISPLE
ncbi:MAG: DUF927 domain-containing protein [Clostridia bacterium]|nr:DUF927 domain-containing protein [Clostridia bacterium]